MDGKVITIICNKSKKKRSNIQKNKSKQLLENQVEIKNNCLKYFYGCWIKCINKKSGEYNSGGFLTKIQGNSIYLRNIQSTNIDLLEFFIDSNTFYVKKYGEQYIAMQQIELEKERNKILLGNNNNKLKIIIERESIFEKEKNIFQKEKNDFEKIKNKFMRLFQDGKAKIII